MTTPMVGLKNGHMRNNLTKKKKNEEEEDRSLLLSHMLRNNNKNKNNNNNSNKNKNNNNNDDDNDDDNNNNNNNDNNNRIQRRNLRFFTISSLRREPSPTRTLKWPVRNRVQLTCNKSSAYHVQRVVLHATWYEGTAQLLSLTELKSHSFELSSIG